MNTLKDNYQAVIDHITADIATLQKNEQEGNTAILKRLQKHHDWLLCRRDELEERRARTILGFHKQLETFMQLCETFWKERHGRTYEAKLDELLEVKKQVTKIYRLSEWDACYALTLAIKPMRNILPLHQYDEYAPALEVLETIKRECYEQLRTYIKT